MSNGKRTPYADDAIHVQNGTQPSEIYDFVERRATNPIEFEEATVWNFNNHVVNEEALADQVDDFLYSEFVIPYQASAVWGFMVTLLPPELQEAEILTYDQSKGRYNPYPCFIRHSDSEKNDEIRRRITEQVRGGSV